MPKVEMPQLHMPKVEMPKFLLPKFRLPKYRTAKFELGTDNQYLMPFLHCIMKLILSASKAT